MSTHARHNARKTVIGFVSSKMGAKSVKVTVPYKTPHPLYHKVINRKTVLHVHDEKNETKVGDKIEVSALRDEQGWLTGTNMRSGFYGFFPESYAKLDGT